MGIVPDEVRGRADRPDIRILLANPGWIDDNYDAADFAASIGASVRYMETWDLHGKMILADGERAYVGSQNFTWTSISRNREAGVVLTENAAITTISGTFEADWDDGHAF